MHPVLLGAAAIAAAALAAAPAAADVTSHDGGLATGHPGHITWDGSPTGVVGFARPGELGERRRGHRRGFGVALNRWYDHDDRTFEHDSYNDWWHERPHRAFPRWTANNPSCERLWWSGGGWRC